MPNFYFAIISVLQARLAPDPARWPLWTCAASEPAAPPSKTIAFDDDDGFSPYACCSVWSQCVAKERPKSLDDTPVEYNGASPLV